MVRVDEEKKKKEQMMMMMMKSEALNPGYLKNKNEISQWWEHA